MRKSLLLALSVIIALGAQAGIKDVQALNAPVKKQQASLMQAARPNHKAKKVATKVAGPMTTAPAGTEYKNLYLTSDAYGWAFSTYFLNVDGALGGVVEGTDGNLYIRGPISQAYIWFDDAPYIKCTPLGDNVYSMETPQIYALDGTDEYYLCRLSYDEEDEFYVVDEENTSIRFKWENNVLTQLDDCYYGLVCEDMWFEIGDTNLKMIVNPDEITLVPENLKGYSATMEYLYLSSKTTTQTKEIMIYDGGDKYYITNIVDELYDNAIVMNKKDGNFEVPTCQYLGADEYSNAHVYLLTGDAQVVDNSNYYGYEPTRTTEFFDQGGNVLATKYPKSLFTNCGRNTIYTIDDFVAPIITIDIPDAINDVNVESTAKVRKYIADGQFIIEKDGIRYNVAGQTIK